MAIEASKFTEKDELIAKFYTLRAGLSVIAEETEKIKKEEKILEALEKSNNYENLKTYDAISNKNKRIEEKESALKRKEDDILKVYEKIERYEIEINTYKSTYKPKFSSFITPMIGALILEPVIFIIVSNILALLFPKMMSNLYKLFWDLMGNVYSDSSLIPLVIAIYIIIPLIIGICSYRGDKNSEIARFAKKNTEKINHEKLYVAKLEREKASLLVEIETLKNSQLPSYNKHSKEINEQKTRLNTQIIPACTKKSKAMKQAMLELSQGIITEADWMNVDLLIFYLETGRADSLKEALLLVDKQRQTNQISYAIREASVYVSTTIDSGLNRLGGIIQTGFDKLGRQIQFNHNESMNTMLNSLAEMSNNNREISKGLSRLNTTIQNEGERIVNAENLNAALLKKANESSDELMHELRYNQRYWAK